MRALLDSKNLCNLKVKIQERMFYGPQIRKLVLSNQLWKEKKITLGSSQGMYGFLGTKIDDNYTHFVAVLLQKYKLGCNMTLKIHFLNLLLDFSPHSYGAVSEEHTKRLHQDISVKERSYQGCWNETKMADSTCFCVKLLQNSLTKPSIDSR